MAYLWLILNLAASPYQDTPRVAIQWQGPGEWFSKFESVIGERGVALFRLPPEASDPLDWGRRHQIDMIVELVIVQADSNVTTRYRLWEVITGEVLDQGQWSSPPPSFRSLLNAFWVPLFTAFDEALPRLKGASVVLRAQPGSVVVIPGREPVVIGESGSEALSLRTPGAYRFRLTHPDFQPLSGVLSALRDGIVFDLTQTPHRWLSVHLGAVMFAFPTLEIRHHYFSDRYFWGVGLEQYLGGIFLGQKQDTNEQTAEFHAFVSFPLFIPYLSAGTYLLEGDASLRPLVIADLGPRILLSPLSLDPLGMFQGSFGVGAEWRYWQELRIELTARIKYFFPPPPDSLGNFLSDEGRLALWATPLGVFQFPVIHGGLSWSF